MRLWNRTIEQMGGEAREIIEAEPPQTDAMGVVLNAWNDLSTCRQVGMSEGWIPWTAADRWCTRHGLDDDESRVLWRVIRKLDIAELERR
ncbi:MAG: hypothetical protein ABI175_17950, partial [Polyangiales bacterium]